MNVPEKTLDEWIESCHEMSRLLGRASQAIRDGRSNVAVGLLDSARSLDLRMARSMEQHRGAAEPAQTVTAVVAAPPVATPPAPGP